MATANERGTGNGYHSHNSGVSALSRTRHDSHGAFTVNAPSCIGGVATDDYSDEGVATMRAALAAKSDGRDLDVTRQHSGTEDGSLWYVTQAGTRVGDGGWMHEADALRDALTMGDDDAPCDCCTVSVVHSAGQHPDCTGSDADPCDCGTVTGATGRYLTHAAGQHPDCSADADRCECVHPALTADGRCSRCTLTVQPFRVQAEGLQVADLPLSAILQPLTEDDFARLLPPLADWQGDDV